VTVNGAPGLWLTRADGAPQSLVALGFTPDGERVAVIYTIRNPDKLRPALNADRHARTTP
jgi:hypothetical protein